MGQVLHLLASQQKFPGDLFYWEIRWRVQVDHVGVLVDGRQNWEKMKLPVQVDPSPVGLGVNV